jgi:4-amino-4-deoxy-L-arabinose transferase-like glycosyltransferase
MRSSIAKAEPRSASFTADRRFRAAWVALMALTALLLFARLGERALWSMEVRWGQIPREMRQTGDPFTPTINGKLYYDKPLGSYWLILAASRLTGDVDEWTARLPSALSGLLAVALLVHISRRLFGDRTALLAGVILATSFSFVGFGRTASADMETVVGELAALALYLGGGRRPAARRVVALWLVMAVTSLTKGLLGFALPLLVIGLHATCTTDASFTDSRNVVARFVNRNRWFFHWATPVAIGLAVALYFAPFAMAQDASIADRGLSMVFRENLQRFFNPVNHKGPVYLYAYVIFGLFAPWSALLPAALTYRRHGESNSARTFALIFFWGTFLFFTLAASRRSYYLLPILPAAALLVARLLATPITECARITRWLTWLGVAVIVAALGAFAVLLVPPSWLGVDLPSLPGRPLVALAALGCATAVVYAGVRFRSRGLAVALGGVAAVAMAFVYLIALPAAEPYRWQRPFAADVRALTGDDVALYRTREMVYYLNPAHDLAEFETESAVRSAVADGRVQWLLLSERDLRQFDLPMTVVARAPVHTWEKGFESGGRTVLARFDGPRHEGGER